jgi:hypothetical protein
MSVYIENTAIYLPSLKRRQSIREKSEHKLLRCDKICKKPELYSLPSLKFPPMHDHD